MEERTHLRIALMDRLQIIAGQCFGGDFAAREEIGQFGDSAFKHECNSLKTILTTDDTDDTDRKKERNCSSILSVLSVPSVVH